MCYNQRSRRSQHLILRIKIIRKEPLVTPPRGLASIKVHRAVKIDRDLVHVMHGTDEEINIGMGREFVDQWGVGRSNPFAFEADQDSNGRAVLFPEPGGFTDVRFVPRTEQGDCVARFDLVVSYQ